MNGLVLTASVYQTEFSKFSPCLAYFHLKCPLQSIVTPARYTKRFDYILFFSTFLANQFISVDVCSFFTNILLQRLTDGIKNIWREVKQQSKIPCKTDSTFWWLLIITMTVNPCKKWLQPMKKFWNIEITTCNTDKYSFGWERHLDKVLLDVW